MNDTEENDNNDDDGEWEDMPDEDMENMEENWKNMKKKTNYMGKKTEKYRAKFSVFHEFTNFSLVIAMMRNRRLFQMGIHYFFYSLLQQRGIGRICQILRNSHKFTNFSWFIFNDGEWEIWKN